MYCHYVHVYVYMDSTIAIFLACNIKLVLELVILSLINAFNQNTQFVAKTVSSDKGIIAESCTWSLVVVPLTSFNSTCIVEENCTVKPL